MPDYEEMIPRRMRIMMYDEFKDLVHARGVLCDISFSEYKIVEFIYTCIPALRAKTLSWISG